MDGLGWTRLGAGRLQTVALAVVAERAFVRMTAHFAASDDAERAGRYAGRASVADVSLNINVLKFILNNGAGWASLVARSRQAVLAMVAHHEPTVKRRLVGHRPQGSKNVRRLFGELFNEFHMTPGGRRQLVRIVIAIAGPIKAIRGELVPLLARHLACLAADAYGGVRVKTSSLLGLRRFTTQERVDKASQQLRHRAAPFTMQVRMDQTSQQL